MRKTFKKETLFKKFLWANIDVKNKTFSLTFFDTTSFC